MSQGLIDVQKGTVSTSTKNTAGDAHQAANWLKAVEQLRRPSE